MACAVFDIDVMRATRAAYAVQPGRLDAMPGTASFHVKPINGHIIFLNDKRRIAAC